MLRPCIAELIATFTLTFVGVSAIVNGQGGLVGIALAHGLALAVAVYASGHISGGHVNPAVTVAMLATGNIQLPKAVAYVIAQCLGALIAAYAANALYGGLLVAGESLVNKANLGVTLGSLSGNPGATLVVEALLTFLLVMTIFGVAVDQRGPKNVYGFAIGLTVGLDILAGGPFTGASMNPARSFGPAFVRGDWTIHWVYWVGPIVGACAAGLLYKNLLMKKDA